MLIIKNIKENLKQNPPVSDTWRKSIYLLSCSCVILLSCILVGRAVVNVMNVELSETWGWLRALDIILVFFCFFDFVILARIFSKTGLKNEKFIFWSLCGFLILNTLWGISKEDYPDENIYNFNTWSYFVTLLIGTIIIAFNEGQIRSLSKLWKKAKNNILVSLVSVFGLILIDALAQRSFFQIVLVIALIALFFLIYLVTRIFNKNAQ